MVLAIFYLQYMHIVLCIAGCPFCKPVCIFVCDKEGSFGSCLRLRGLSATNYLLAQLTKM